MKPFIAPETQLPEITFKVIILSIVLALILAVANAYLALKIGILTSASIPAAILSMGILKFFNRSNILENNLVQTAASAGEAVAGGIVFTIPALVIIHYWMGFSYWENFFIALVGGVLGVLFSIPLRKVLMVEPHLRFPEGKAIAAVLKAGSTKQIALTSLLSGGFIGAIMQFLQTGLKLISNNIQIWFTGARTIFGFGAGFSATMLGAGYLIGFDVGFSILVGALIAWLITVPILGEFYHVASLHQSAKEIALNLLGSKIRYIGIGAMLVAGLWTLLTLFKPLYNSLKSSLKVFQGNTSTLTKRTEKDMPLKIVFLGSTLVLFICWFLFKNIFPLHLMGLSTWSSYGLLIVSLVIVVIIGFIFSAITGYFSGLVGVTASPGSAIVIAGLLIAGLIIHTFMGFGVHSTEALKAGAATAIIIGGVLTGIACIANDNIQDLKVGHIVGATPWRQQLMLLLGAIIAAAIIPLVMQLLFNVYGIADVVPRAGMPLSQTLPAPPAAAMAAITQGVFQGNLPWGLLGIGAGIVFFFIIMNRLIIKFNRQFSVLSIAIGIYLPLSTTIPIFFGALFALLVKQKIKRSEKLQHVSENHPRNQRGLLLACGLVAGSAITDVILAIPFAIAKSPDVLQIHLPDWHLEATLLGILFVIALGVGFYKLASKPTNSVHKLDS